MTDLTKIREEFKKAYFSKVAEIWEAFKEGSISAKDRDKELSWYREKLSQLQEIEK